MYKDPRKKANVFISLMKLKNRDNQKNLQKHEEKYKKKQSKNCGRKCTNWIVFS